MIHRFLRKILAAGCCMLLLAGCDTGAAENAAPRSIASESEGDRLIDSADLIGSVTSVEADGFAVQPTETDGDIAMQAAEDNDAAGTGTRVQLGEDGSVETAVIDVASGAVTTTAAAAADVRRGAYVAVFGDTQADGSILATRVVIVQYAQTTGEGGGDE